MDEIKKKKTSKRESQIKPQKPTTDPPSKVITPDEEDESFREMIRISTDSTAVQEFVLVDNISYSREIIDEVREIINFEKFMSLRKDRSEFLKEGIIQIKSLWHGIHALVVHTEMFTVLFLIAMGMILIEIKKTFKKPHDYAKWRKSEFDERHTRWFQQAVQLAEMGNFSRKYAALGKKRILQLEHIRKTENFKTCEDILEQCPPDEDIEFSTIPDEVVKRMDIEPFPDISYDLQENLVKHYVDSVITFHRLKNHGIDYADFDDAKLLAKYCRQAFPVQEAAQLKSQLEEQDENERFGFFEDFVMDRKVSPSNTESKSYQYTLDKILGDFLKYCKEKQIGDDEEWLEQADSLDKESLLEAYQYLNLIIEKIGANPNTKTENIEG